MRITRFAAPFLVLGLAVNLGGCGVGSALGGDKSAPDEFAIATKAPLVVPPDYALLPPRPGESRPQELSPSERAQQVLLGDPNAAPPTYGEQLLLQKSGAFAADSNIRNILNAETGGRADKDASFANQLIFWNYLSNGEIDDSAAPLRVENPEEWYAQRTKRIKDVVGEEGKVEINDDKALNLPGVY